jgi:hypothetical protein
MNLTKSKLKQIIKEEISKIRNEKVERLDEEAAASEELLQWAVETVSDGMIHNFITLQLSSPGWENPRNGLALRGKSKEEILQMYLEDLDSDFDEIFRFHIKRDRRFNDSNIMRAVYEDCQPQLHHALDSEDNIEQLQSIPEFAPSPDWKNPRGHGGTLKKCHDYVGHSGGRFVRDVIPKIKERVKEKYMNGLAT